VSKFRERAGTNKKKLAQASPPMSSASVAELGYRAWQANKRVEITGFRNRFLATAVPFLPRTAVLGVVRNLQSPL
jgi:short-subunit dehydrogenase